MNQEKKPEKHWLDKIIEEQAAYYGMSVEKHGKLMNDVAQYLEDIERKKP